MESKLINFLRPCIVLVFFAVSAQAQPGDRFGVEDYYMTHWISSPAWSPDGKGIAYVLRSKEVWDGDYNTDIYLMPAGGGGAVRLTTSPKSDFHPQWSSDGRTIAFQSSREGSSQVYTLPVDGGEAMKFTSAERSVMTYRWAGGNRIAYVQNEPRDAAVVKREDEAGGGRVAGQEFVTSAIWLQAVAGKQAEKVTDGSYYIKDFDVSPDGSRYAVIAMRNSDLYNAYTSAEVRLLDNRGNTLHVFRDARALSMPQFSPDGRHVAFRGTTEGFSADDGLFVMSTADGKVQNLTHAFDPTILQFAWTGPGAIAFSTHRNAVSGIYSVDLSGKVTPVVKPHFVLGGFSVAPGGKNIALAASLGTQPPELYSLPADGDPAAAKALTSVNAHLGKYRFGKVEVVKYKASDGSELEAVVTWPVNYQAGRKYPILVMPHGGPDGISTPLFSIADQLFAQAGIIVFEPNFRGGIGYGREFYKANRGKLGYIDYDDIMQGLDHMIGAGAVDTSKMVVGGWSYGGFMTNWIIGHTSRFRCAVSVAGISNTVSMYGQGDINHSDIARWEFLGVPVKDMENYLRSSPIMFLKNCTTPTLFLHGEADDRVHPAQVWEAYRALNDLGVRTELVLYPKANHSIRSPLQYRDVMNRWVQWYVDCLGME